MTDAGGVYRRCGCADPATGRQLGGNCPQLADDNHGSWYIQLELPAALDGARRRIRRGGYPSHGTAKDVLAGLRIPAPGDPHADLLTVGGLAGVLAGLPHLPSGFHDAQLCRSRAAVPGPVLGSGAAG